MAVLSTIQELRSARYSSYHSPKSPAGSTGRCNTGLEFTRRSFKAQGFARALI